MSREERKKEASSSQKDFWWLSDRSFTDSSTPKDDSPVAKRTRRFTPHSPINPYKNQVDKKSTSQVLICRTHVQIRKDQAVTIPKTRPTEMPIVPQIADSECPVHGGLSDYWSLTLNHSGQLVWIAPCSLHFKDITYRFQKRVCGLQLLQKTKPLDATKLLIFFPVSQSCYPRIPIPPSQLPSYSHSSLVVTLVFPFLPHCYHRIPIPPSLLPSYSHSSLISVQWFDVVELNMHEKFVAGHFKWQPNKQIDKKRYESW